MKTEISALPFLPKLRTLDAMREASRKCRGCPLYKSATQTVFGMGSDHARVMFVGEQPGNEEDRQGAPFVGPAGRVLDKALIAAGIDRGDTYVTNVVKHFKWVAKGSRRLHKKPSAREIAACIPWLEEEIEIIKPEVLVLLGASAAQAILGKEFRVSKQRGQLVPTKLAPYALATIHPSSVLRMPTSEDRHRALEMLTSDMRVVASVLAGSPSAALGSP